MELKDLKNKFKMGKRTACLNISRKDPVKREKMDKSEERMLLSDDLE